MSSFKRDKKEEEDGGGNPFQNIEKTTVLQEARIFNETSVNPRKCTPVLTKLLYLLNQGETLNAKEATDVFFAMTKLFQSKDVILRRMVYLGIKELSPIADDVIIVTSSLTKDMTGKEDMYRAAAIRALCSITDATMLQAIERYMKQAIVDRNSAVSSAALVSSLHMIKLAPDVVKRWVNEAQEAVNSDNIMVQYHALGLLYHIRKSDRLAVTKLIAKLTRMSLKSPYAVCMLVKEEDSGNDSPYFEFIESCLRHKSEMVVYEAAHAIVNLNVQPVESWHRPLASFSCSVVHLNQLFDLLLSIATLAITTLLKTGAESSVDRLMKQIATFVSEISDEFKVVVVQAIRALALKFPRKHSVLMNFLSAMLRDEGGLEYKASIADTIITIIEDNPETKETGLAHLCEFIEDCEHVSLAVRILHLLGKEGPKTKQPSRFVREHTSATRCCQMDSDDEVRDRATYYSWILNKQDKSLYNNYILDTLQVSIPSLERSLKEYTQGDTDEAFDIKTVPLAPVRSDEEREVKHKAEGMLVSQGPTKLAPISREENFAEKLSAIPSIQNLGPLFRSSEMVELTESETEYYVRCIKHCFTGHMVLQFDCLNTLSDQLLENVRVQLDPSENYQILVKFPENDLPNSIGTFGAVLKFIVKDCDPTTGLPDSDEGYDDEYMLEDLEVTLADQIQKVNKVNWAAAWEEAASNSVELEDTYSLSSMNSLDEAVKNIIQFLGLQPAERSDKVPEGKNTHTLLLAGMFRGGIDILVRAKLAYTDSVTMQLTVRSSDANVAELITSAVG
ncbi:hypothetical protein NQ317_016023 [Molorchus minor]|uniref:Coatomer subunit gamma n=1 Tax=Molorchus minor TaxID=1323400 RepID=A0ABQ9JS96_9CUCU|nr:hypothetical protein NQ317_016023 [Molorchus minor]